MRKEKVLVGVIWASVVTDLNGKFVEISTRRGILFAVKEKSRSLFGAQALLAIVVTSPEMTTNEFALQNNASRPQPSVAFSRSSTAGLGGLRSRSDSTVVSYLTSG